MAAAPPVLMPATAPAPRGSSLVALAVGLVAVMTGVALLLVVLLLPDSRSSAIAVPHSAVNRAATLRRDVIQDAREGTGVTEDPHLRFTAMTEPDPESRAELVTTNASSRVAQSAPGILSSDLIQKVRRLRACTGTNTESTHLASVPLCSDARGALMEMATMHSRGPWTGWDGTGAAAAQAASAVPVTEVAPAASETVLLVEPVGPPQSGRDRIYSRITLRPHARWETDLDAGPLTLFVQHGRVGVVFDAGSGQVEFQDLLFGKRIDPVLPRQRMVLWPGDRLVVSTGLHLRVDNDDASLAIISVSRLQASPSVGVESE